MIVQKHPDNLVYIRTDEWETQYVDTLENFGKDCVSARIPFSEEDWSNEFIYYSTIQRTSTMYNRKDEVITEGSNQLLEHVLQKVNTLLIYQTERNTPVIPPVPNTAEYWYSVKYEELMNAFEVAIAAGYVTSSGFKCQLTNDDVGMWYYGLLKAQNAGLTVMPVVCDYDNELHYNMPMQQFIQIFAEMGAASEAVYTRKWRLRELLKQYLEQDDVESIKAMTWDMALPEVS